LPIWEARLVAGAGIGGLTAAKALSSYFEKVTILERDTLPSGPEARTGHTAVATGACSVRSGLDALSKFFPDFEAELERAGAVRARVGSEILA
jgi:phytoene dehydrogenase-like protein